MIIRTCILITQESLQKIKKDSSLQTRDMKLLANFNEDVKQQKDWHTYKNLNEFITSVQTF